MRTIVTDTQRFENCFSEDGPPVTDTLPVEFVLAIFPLDSKYLSRVTFGYVPHKVECSSWQSITIMHLPIASNYILAQCLSRDWNSCFPVSFGCWILPGKISILVYRFSKRQLNIISISARLPEYYIDSELI